MTLANLERFVTGPALFKSSVRDEGFSSLHLPLGQKRKPEAVDEEQLRADNALYKLTLTKLLTAPDSRRRIEPPLQKYMFLKSIINQLQHKMAVQSPCKRRNHEPECHVDQSIDMMSQSAALGNLHLAPSMGACGMATHSSPLMACPNRFNELSLPVIQSSLPTLSQLSADERSNSSILAVNNNEECAGTAFNNFSSEYSSQFSKRGECERGDAGLGALFSVPGVDMEIESSPSPVIDTPTEIVDNAMIPSFDNLVDFQSLVQCSMDQFGLKEGAAGTCGGPGKSHAHADELDSIMQVLVGM